MNWYKYDISSLTETEYEKWYSNMCPQRQKKVNDLKIIDDKKRTVAGEMLAKKAISNIFNINPEIINIYTDKNGKPYVENCDVQFNISHSENIVVCAIDEKKIGIDIEKIRPINLKIAKHICSQEEIKYLFGFAPEENDFVYTEDWDILCRFFEIWTGKEAYGKCIGTGIKELINLPFNQTDYFNIIDGFALSIKTS